MAQKLKLRDIWWFIGLGLALLFLGLATRAQSTMKHWIWISPDEIAQLPMSGPGWTSVKAAADRCLASPTITLADQDDKADSEAMAAAMVWRRTGDERYRAAVESACLGVIGTEGDNFPGENNSSLEHARNVACVVIAAQLIELENPAFDAWVDMIRTHERGDGRSLVSTQEERPNNWGTHAGASRLACSIYLEDWKDVSRSVRVFAGWLGVRGFYSGFNYGELYWQANPERPVGINRFGAVRSGHSIDGVLPDDQRRSGGFQWPPPKENYVYEALQGVLAQAVMIDRLGLPEVWTVKQKAILRAYVWLHEEADFPAESDDTWQPWIVNKVYDTAFPASTGGAQHGKALGFADWTSGAPSWP